jgi:hypothetical protein
MSRKLLNQPKTCHSKYTPMKPFFIVWNIHKQLPVSPIRHTSQCDAIAEAELLARLNPDDTFYVMRLVSITKLPKPPSITSYVDNQPSSNESV